MRILQISQRPQRRGAEVFAYRLSAELRRLGHEVRIAYLYPHGGERTLTLNSGDVLLDGNEHHALETWLGVHPALLRRLGRLMKRFRPQLTQVNGARTIKYGTVARAMYGRSGAVVYRNIGSTGDWVRGIRRRLFYRAILRSVDGVIAISERSLEELRAAFPPQTPISVISNAVDPATLRPIVTRNQLREALSTPSNARVAIFVGSLSREKRVERLIDAVHRARQKVSDLHLWIVGDGPLRAELEGQVVQLGIKDVVHFVGVQDDVASYLAASDLLALVSDTEGVPGVVLEAGYMGLPVVATRVGAVDECVENGETGLLVDVGDREALVSALVRLTSDIELANRFGRRARVLIASRHTIENIALQFLDFYGRVSNPGCATTNASDPPHVVPSAPTRGSHRAEMQLLLASARTRLSGEDKLRIARLMDAPLNWSRLLALAARHKMLPLLAVHLRDFERRIPERALEQLRALEVENACRMLQLTGELLRILREFREHGIDVVPYKGPVLGLQLYGAVSLRQVGDLDLIVRRRDVERARTLLLTAGYRPRHPLAKTSKTFMVKSRYSETFTSSSGFSAELHWAFTSRDVALPLGLDDLTPRRGTIRLADESVPILGPEDLLLLLCVHGSKHRWDRLEWLCGVSEVIRNAKEIDWDALVARASSLGARRMLLLGLLLSHDMLGAPVPQHILRIAFDDRSVVGLSALVPTILIEPPTEQDAMSLPVDLFRLRLRERWRDRMRFVLYRLTTPSRPERWALVGIGGRVIPLHALVRPFQLLTKAVPAARWYLASGRKGGPR